MGALRAIWVSAAFALLLIATVPLQIGILLAAPGLQHHLPRWVFKTAARFMGYVAGMTMMWMLSPKGIPFARAHESFKQQISAAFTPAGDALRPQHD